MRQTLLVFFACIVWTLASARAQSGADPGDIYVNAYLTVQAAEKAEQAGNFRTAASKFKSAAKVLDDIATRWPTWQPPMVEYRRKRTAESIARVADKMGKYGPGRVEANDGGLGEPALPTSDDKPLIFDASEAPLAPLPGTGVGSNLASRGTPRRAIESETGGDPLQGLALKMQRLQSDLTEARDQAARAEREKQDVAQKLEQADKARKQAEAKQEVLQKRADLSEQALTAARAEGKTELVKIKSLEAGAADAKKQLRDFRIDADADAEYRRQLNERFKAQLEKLAKLNLLRDASAPGKIQEIQQQLERTKKERDDLAQKLQVVTGQRDEALAQVAKLKDAQKQVDKLVADNAALMAKLADAEAAVTQFRTVGMEKDKEIAALKKQVGSMTEQLAQAKKESADYQRQMADLQTRLEASGKQLAEAKAENAASAAEKKRMQEENTILRGIVLRQQKQEAVRAATKKMVLGELAKLEINSKTLLKQIDLLSQPVVKLTEKELKLFKSPELQVSDGEIAMNISKNGETAVSAGPGPLPETTPTVALNSVETGSTPEAKVSAGPPNTVEKSSDMPSPPTIAPELNSAKLQTPGPTLPGAKGSEKKGEKSEPTDAGATTPGRSAADDPKVPADLLPMARAGKEQFDRGNYLEAEKTYRKILAKVPSNLYTLYNLGVVLFRAQKFPQAVEIFKKAIAIAPADSLSHATLGIVYYNLKKFDEAINELTKAIAIDPNNPTAHNYLGITASEKGLQGPAQEELEKAVALDPTYADAFFNLAVVFATKTPPDYDNARKNYKRAVELGAAPDPALEQMIK